MSDSLGFAASFTNEQLSFSLKAKDCSKGMVFPSLDTHPQVSQNPGPLCMPKNGSMRRLDNQVQYRLGFETFCHAKKYFAGPVNSTNVFCSTLWYWVGVSLMLFWSELPCVTQKNTLKWGLVVGKKSEWY